MNQYYLAYFVGLVMGATNGITTSFISLSSYETAYVRFCLATPLLLLLFLLLQKGQFTFYRYKKSMFFLTLSGLALGGNVLFLFEAYRTLGVSLAILANYVGPVIVILLSPLLFHETLTPAKLAAVGVVLVGVMLVNGQVFLEGSSAWGLFCGAMAAVCFAAMNICNKFAQDIKGLENSLLAFFFATIVIGVVVGCQQGLVVVPAASDWAPLLFLGLISTGIGNNLYFVAAKRLPAQTIAVCGYLEPVLVMLFSFLILHEIMSPVQLFGAACIIGGAVFCEMRPRHIVESEAL